MEIGNAPIIDGAPSANAARGAQNATVRQGVVAPSPEGP
jgi:hypothetical protein